MKRIAALWIVVLASGCAGPQLAPSPVSSSEEAEAGQAMRSERLPPELWAEGDEQAAMVRRVQQRIRPATRKVCARTLDRETCARQYRKIRVQVKPEDDTINATADVRGNVTLYGGLMRRIGSDDELAGVMAHEMAHVLLKHNEKSQQNMTVGLIVGGLVAGLAGAAGGPCYTAQCANAQADLVGAGMEAGAVAGAVAYSPQMELEADQLATYIVNEAGYDLYAARKLFIRLARTGRRGGAAGKRALAGFLRTHPTDAKRIAHWSATRRLIESGRQSPESRQSVAERQRRERLAAKCERLYREYPECPDWGKAGLTGLAGRMGRMTKGICPFPAPVKCAGPG